jgi:hypothetical protein
MSQFPPMPPGTPVPPNQLQSTPPAQGFNPQQQPHYGYQQQTPSPYGAPAPTYGPPAASHSKPTNAFGQAFTQAMTTGKPMFNKLGKTISSKLGSKPAAQSTPQHLESFQNYQQHQQQFKPPPQQSPFPQPTYGTPASGNSTQSNYFPQQPLPSPNSQAPHQQPSTAPGYNPNSFVQGGNGGGVGQGQPTYGQVDQSQPQGPTQQATSPQPQSQGPQPQHEQYFGQQTGVVGVPQPHLPSTTPQSPHPNNFPDTSQPGSQQQQWAPSPNPQLPQPFNPTPPPQQFNTVPSPQQYHTAPPLPIHPNQQQQQWAASSPVSPQLQSFQPVPPASPPPQVSNQQEPGAITSSEIQQHQNQESQHQSPAPAFQPVPPQASPSEFIAELPADLDNLTFVESSKPERPPSYQAFRPAGAQSASPRPGFTVPRRAVSMSTLPLADPWRFADPATNLPTREFFIIADLIFDTIDRKFEPQSTGLMEASKMLESWRVQGFADEAARKSMAGTGLLSLMRIQSFSRMTPILLLPNYGALSTSLTSWCLVNLHLRLSGIFHITHMHKN